MTEEQKAEKAKSGAKDDAFETFFLETEVSVTRQYCRVKNMYRGRCMSTWTPAPFGASRKENTKISFTIAT